MQAEGIRPVYTVYEFFLITAVEVGLGLSRYTRDVRELGHAMPFASPFHFVIMPEIVPF